VRPAGCDRAKKGRKIAPGLVNIEKNRWKITIVNGKTMGKPWENHGKTMGKPWENGDVYGKSPFLMGKSTIKWQVSIVILVYQRLNYKGTLF
jgi:hypothetical protein